jgi:hypothetical protein
VVWLSLNLCSEFEAGLVAAGNHVPTPMDKMPAFFKINIGFCDNLYTYWNYFVFRKVDLIINT